MKRFATDDYGGFIVHDIVKANFQHDWTEIGQGVSIRVTKRDGGPNKPDTYVASTADGKYSAEGADEADASFRLRSQMQDRSLRGEV